MEDKAEGAS